MAKPSANRLLLLLSVYTALLVIACGAERRAGGVAAAATATAMMAGVGANRATCGAGTDQPLCDDPTLDKAVDGGEGAATDAPDDRQTKQQRALPKRKSLQNNSSRDREVCASPDAVDCIAATEGTPAGSTGRPRFQSGDVIELYNTESRDVQIVFPSIVKGREPGPSGGYSVTKTTDGREVKNVPERFLHMYVPYRKGDEVLCNIGEFKPSRPIIVRCTVLDYAPAASRGAMVLQGSYSVRVHETKASEENETELPVWKLQRRYMATVAAS